MWLAKIESGTWFLNRVAIFSHKYNSIKGIFPGTSPLSTPACHAVCDKSSNKNAETVHL